MEIMMSLKTYLETHFVDKPTYAELAEISVDRLEDLIALNAVSTFTYCCDGRSIYSAVFGCTPISEPITGEFFRPECSRWVRIAHQAAAGDERRDVLRVLKHEVISALKAYYTSDEQIQAIFENYLPAFFDGTFGLCVAAPSTGAGIVRKEELQKTLIALTKNGTVFSPAGVTNKALKELIEQYANASMPFSPAEYQRSSRKRLVDDLLASINTLEAAG